MHAKPTKGPEPNCVCKTCGERFYCKPSLIRLRNGGQHCSRACKFANPNVMAQGESHPNWAGDAAQETSKRLRAQRRYALTDCEECGKPATDRHHIDGDTGNNSEGNIARLCRRCHMSVDGRLERLRIAQVRKLTEGEVGEIRAELDALPIGPGGRRPLGSVAALAARYGVSGSTLDNIRHGKR